MKRPSIEDRYKASVSLAHRKRFAQFFTPQPIATLMAEWLLGNERLHTVLEPAFGLGIFTRTLLQAKTGLEVKGFEVDEVIYKQAQSAFAASQSVEISLNDYMRSDWSSRYDGIICNPPYFKFHNYDNKPIIEEMERRLHCSLTGFCNLYALFLLKSVYQLAPQGRVAYIVPSEFLNADYGKAVKQWLLKSGRLRHVIVFNFEEKVFDDALTTASIILCAADEQTHDVKFSYVSSLSELSALSQLIREGTSAKISTQTLHLSDIQAEVKWRRYYYPHEGRKYQGLVPFTNYARVVRGIATGSNDYFTFNQKKAADYGISSQYLLPCVCHAVDVRGNIFQQRDFEALSDAGKKVFLFNALSAANENVLEYLKKGEAEGVNRRYLTAQRNPWYAIEKRPPAPIWVSVFNRTGLRFVRNEAGVRNLTTFHCVYPQTDVFSAVSVDLLFAYLLTDTARIIFEENRREYGNGLQKYEPNDLNKGAMLNIATLPDADKEQMENLLHAYEEKEERKYINEMDALLTTRFAVC